MPTQLFPWLTASASGQWNNFKNLIKYEKKKWFLDTHNSGLYKLNLYIGYTI